MNLAASELILLNDDPIHNAKALSKIVPNVELMLDGDAWDDVPNAWMEKATALSRLPIRYTVHPPAWDHNIAAGLYSLRKTAQDLNRVALNVAARVGARQMVFHTGYCDANSRFSRKIAQRHSMEALFELIEVAKPLGITLAVENVAAPQNALYTQEEFSHILDGVDETAQYLIDIGHANFNGWDIPRLIEQLAPRICGLHIHDNNGRSDQHLPIFQGTVDWDRTFSAMDSLRPDCHFVLEYAPGTPLTLLKAGVDALSARFG